MLDVATGKGQFVGTLIEELDGYTEIIGLDIDGAGEGAFRAAYGELPSVSFMIGDANDLPFPGESFDTVAICGSLHHVAEPERVLREMWRVLTPGGRFVVLEQIREGQAGPHLTHLMFHEWSEELLGIARPVYERASLVRLIDGLNLESLAVVEQYDQSDPRDAVRVQRFLAFVDEYLERAGGRKTMTAQGKRIRTRLKRGGIAIASWLCIVGTKPLLAPRTDPLRAAGAGAG